MSNIVLPICYVAEFIVAGVISIIIIGNGIKEAVQYIRRED